jgi:hypothetical protein
MRPGPLTLRGLGTLTEHEESRSVTIPEQLRAADRRAEPVDVREPAASARTAVQEPMVEVPEDVGTPRGTV